MPLLQVKNLKTYFFTRSSLIKAVDGISLFLNEGETLGIVGESGSGKSVTCMSILGLVPQPAGRIVEGEILFDGQDLLQKSKKEMRGYRGKHLSMILQDPMSSLNPVFTIGWQVTEAIILHQKAKASLIKQKAVEALRLVRIPDPKQRFRDYPHQFSGGMRQRIVGAIGLSCEPRLLIADEPTTSLDVTIQAQYLNLLREIQKKKRTAIIFVTHDFGIVARMCDRVAVMYAGKILEVAPVKELFDNPYHPYSEALMDAVPRLEYKAERLRNIDGQPPDLSKLPLGCSFAPRCHMKTGKCLSDEFPPNVEVETGHWACCWKYA